MLVVAPGAGNRQPAIVHTDDRCALDPAILRRRRAVHGQCALDINTISPRWCWRHRQRRPSPGNHHSEPESPRHSDPLEAGSHIHDAANPGQRHHGAHAHWRRCPSPNHIARRHPAPVDVADILVVRLLDRRGRQAKGDVQRHTVMKEPPGFQQFNDSFNRLILIPFMTTHNNLNIGGNGRVVSRENQLLQTYKTAATGKLLRISAGIVSNTLRMEHGVS